MLPTTCMGFTIYYFCGSSTERSHITLDCTVAGHNLPLCILDVCGIPILVSGSYLLTEDGGGGKQ